MNDIQTLYFYLVTILSTGIFTSLISRSNVFRSKKCTIFKCGTASWEIVHSKLLLLLCAFLPMILAACLRVDTGADYQQYTWNFIKFALNTDKFNYIFSSREPLYYFVQYISIKIFGNNYYWWFAIMAIGTFIIMIIAIEKIDRYLNYTIFIVLFGFYAYLHMYNYVRQLFAMSLILMAIAYLYEHKWIKFLAFIVFASLMHQSSIVFLIIGILYWKKQYLNNHIYHILMLVSPVFLGGAVVILRRIPYFILYFTRYFGDSFNLGIGWIVDVIPVLVLYFLVCSKDRNINENGKFLMEISWLIIPIRALSYYSYAAGRLFIDFTVIAILGFSIIVDNQNNATIKKAISILLLLGYYMYSFYMGNNSEVFPYQSLL